MDSDVLVPLLVPLLVAPAVWWAARRWQPLLATWAVTLVAVGAAVASTMALLLLAVTAALMRWDALGIVAAALLVASIGSVRVAWWQRTTALRAARQQAARGQDGAAIVVLSDDVPVAFALPGKPGRIVVSRGMMRALDAGQRRALLAHERAHLSAHHHRFLAAVDLACAANPVLWPLRATVRYTVERWADEAAATTTGDRRLTARAIAVAALAGRGVRTIPAMAGATSGPVPQRVAALLARPVPTGRGRRLVLLLAIALVATSVGVTLEFAVDLHRLLD